MKLNDYLENKAKERNVYKTKIAKELAKKLNVSYQSLIYWYKCERNISVKHAILLNKITEDEVKLSDLRPDLWGKKIINKISGE